MGFSPPKLPAPPPLPPTPPPVTQEQRATEAREGRAEQRRLRSGQRGRAATLLSGGAQGDDTSGGVVKRLLGG